MIEVAAGPDNAVLADRESGSPLRSEIAEFGSPSADGTNPCLFFLFALSASSFGFFARARVDGLLSLEVGWAGRLFAARRGFVRAGLPRHTYNAGGARWGQGVERAPLYKDEG